MASIRTLVVIAAGATALTLAGYAALVLHANDGEVTLVDGIFGDAPQPESDAEARERHERLRLLAQGMTKPEESIFDDPEDAPAMSPGVSVTRDDARSGFDYVMRRVERLGRKRRRLNQDQWDETWRTANDAYTALSMQLDGEDAADLAELEQAHRRLKRGLRRVKVRGGKFR